MCVLYFFGIYGVNESKLGINVSKWLTFKMVVKLATKMAAKMAESMKNTIPLFPSS